MPHSSTRQRLLKAARDLFVRQGITQTTTRQIADLAGVNEVTLFRHFGTKQGLLLAVFGELGVFSGIADLPLQNQPSGNIEGSQLQSILLNYVYNCFRALADNPELVRSLVGEAGSYSPAHRRALREGFLKAQEQLRDYLYGFFPPNPEASKPDWVGRAAGVLHLMILGAAVLEVTAQLPTSSAKPDPNSTLSPEKGIPPLLQACVEVWMAGMTGMK
ncbi:TetR/AcrR family transcriptional regulator [Thermostichus vulcanus]|uniref:TetR/AcrR family transcriptional regulator n=1 Tax=Thermostichus vulcanus str. 'Rupite' TaxID=2813851 RepID=A0ABT0C9Y5_THEVL|nr:TetR/AcrR family transcriptional regulator [Thermostichus vulcanus]MCJ2542598.1 TetR/AcrR family transcriptional regulator [Thermostichus vulcanus str. 'Rupite']